MLEVGEPAEKLAEVRVPGMPPVVFYARGPEQVELYRFRVLVQGDYASVQGPRWLDRLVDCLDKHGGQLSLACMFKDPNKPPRIRGIKLIPPVPEKCLKHLPKKAREKLLELLEKTSGSRGGF